MQRSDHDELLNNYKALFSEEDKAKAFDDLAEKYYIGNFGTMQKSDIDVLMFSLFIERILDKGDENINAYSDYTLAKQLGITQSRIRNLKHKKQLQYPRKEFDWQKSFHRVCNNARYEKGKIRINLRDINLYYELVNQIDMMGGYAETTLTRNLLVITPGEFFILCEAIMDEQERQMLEKNIRGKYKKNEELSNRFTELTLGEALSEQLTPTAIIEMLVDIAAEMMAGPASFGLKALFSAAKSAKKYIK